MEPWPADLLKRNGRGFFHGWPDGAWVAKALVSVSDIQTLRAGILVPGSEVQRINSIC